MRLRKHRQRLGQIGLAALMLSSAILPMIQFDSASAATGVILPNSDVTTQWAHCNGTTTCSSARYTYVDEDVTSPNDSDYIGTGGPGVSTAAAQAEFGMTVPPSVDTVSSVQVFVRARSATNAEGGTLDNLLINLRIGGALQTAVTVTPAYSTSTWTNYSGTFNGSWTQAQIDGAQVVLTRSVLGGGNPTSQQDDIRVSAVSATVTYVQGAVYDQSSYRWFEDNEGEDASSFVTGWGGTGEENAESVAQLSDGGYITAGYTTNYGAGGQDAFLARYDRSGTLAWSRTWGGTGNDYANNIALSDDGGFVITGFSGSYGGGSTANAFLAKFTVDGTLSWSRTWGGSGYDNGLFVIQTSDGGYAMAGQTYSYTAGNDDMFLAKYTSDGTLSWSRTWGGAGRDWGYSLKQTNDGGYAVTGNTASVGSGGTDMFINKFDSTGTLSWSRTWGGAGTDWGISVAHTSDGGYAVTGYTTSYGAGGNDAYIAKYTSAGTLSWSRTWGGAGTDVGRFIEQTDDGGYAIAGYTTSYGAGSNDTFLAKFDSAGTLSYSRTWGGTGDDIAYSFTQTNDGGYAMTGQNGSYSAGSTDSFLAKFNSSGTIEKCDSPMCQSPTASSSSVTAGTTTPTITLGSPSAGTDSPTVPSSSPSPIVTEIVKVTGQIDVGAPLALANTAAEAPAEGTSFRLRMNLHVSIGTAQPGSASFKLQYAARGADNVCDTAFSDETYTDLSPTSGPIRYANSTTAAEGYGLVTNINDPTHGADDIVRQSFEESNNFTIANAIPAGDDGMWDFSLVDHSAPSTTTYCFRAVDPAGGALNSYAVVPQLTTGSGTLAQTTFRAYENQDATLPDNSMQAFGGTSTDIGADIVATSDGGYVVTGETISYGAGSQDVLLSKFDSTGQLSWSRTWGGSSNDLAYAVVQTSDGGFAVTGSTRSYGGGSQDMFLIKFDSSGTLNWAHTWGGSGDDWGNALIESSDNSIIVVGRNGSSGTSGSVDALVVKYDSSGTHSWSRNWGGTGTDYGADIIEASNGDYAITGYSASYGAGGNDMFLATINSSGSLVWARTWGGSGDDIGRSLILTNDNGFVVTGNTLNYGAGGSDLSLVKYDSAGNLSWSRTWGGTGAEYGHALIQTSDNGFAVTGRTASYGAGSEDLALIKYDSAGNLSWSRTWGGTGSDAGNAVIELGESIVVTGRTASYGAGGVDGVNLIYDSTGNIANCVEAICQSGFGSSSSPTASVSSPTTGTGFVSPNTSSPSATVNSPSLTVTIIPLPPMTFAKSFDYSDETVYDTVQTSDGGFATTGSFTTGLSNVQMFLAKYDSNGVLSWMTSWGDTGTDIGRAVIQTSDGGFAVTGSTTSYSATLNDMFLAKFTSAGSHSWSVMRGGNGDDYARDVIQTSDGGYAVTGTYWIGTGDTDLFLAKFTSTGTLSYFRIWGGGTSDEDHGYSLVQTSDSGFAVIGSMYRAATSRHDVLLAKFDSAGAHSWSRAWSDGASNVTGYGIVQTSDGGYAATGVGTNFFLIRYDSAGSQTWSRTLTDQDAIGRAIVQTSDGGYAVTGELNSADIFLAKFTSSGSVAWMRSWSSSGVSARDVGHSIVQTSDGGYAVAGEADADSLSPAGTDAVLLKYDSYGTIAGCSRTMCQSPIATAAAITAILNVHNPNTPTVTPTGRTPAVTLGTTAPSGQNIVSASPIKSFTNGTALADQDMRSELLAVDDTFRLRIGILATGGKAYTQTTTLKLQYGLHTGTCDPSTTSYTDLSSATSPLAFFDNPVAATGDQILGQATDPTFLDANPVWQTYAESNTFDNPHQMRVGELGLWDFSLKADGSKIGRTYCFRVVESGGTLSGGYAQYAEVYIPPTMTNVMRHGTFFNQRGALQPFAWGRE